MSTTAPPGFLERNGLLLPESVALETVTWPHDDPDRRALERAQLVAEHLDLQLVLRCVHPRCIQNDLACTYLTTHGRPDGSHEFRCNHLIRICPVSPQQERAAQREAVRRAKRLRSQK